MSGAARRRGRRRRPRRPGCSNGCSDGTSWWTPRRTASEWYRYHPLLRQLLQAELRADESRPGPGAARPRRRVVRGERRARARRSTTPTWPATRHGSAGWCSRRCRRSGPAAGSTRSLRWMERLGRRAPAPHTPAMIAHGALIFALLGPRGRRRALGRRGRGAAGHRHAARRQHGRRAPWPTCGRTCAATARPRCAGTRPRRWTGSARPAPTAPRWSTREGLSYLLEGDLERADASFAHAYDLAASLESSPVAGARARRAVPGRRRA